MMPVSGGLEEKGFKTDWMKRMEAIILAGGLGTRLRTVVREVPKCMAPVAGHPFLRHVLRYLQENEVSHVVLALGYKHETVSAWVERQDFDMDFSFSVEDVPLGTGGALRKALAHIKGTTSFVLNGDTFFRVALKNFYLCHCRSRLPVTLALKPMQKFRRYGNVEIGPGGVIRTFHEKGYCDSGYINGGVYCVDKDEELFAGCAEAFSFERELLQRKVQQGIFNGFVSDSYFIDIGIPEDYEKANRDFLALQGLDG